MRRIKKQFTKTTISVSAITVVNGNVVVTPLSPVETFETVTPNNAVKLFKKFSTIKDVAKMALAVTDCKSEIVTYAMDGETFIKNAYVVSNDDLDEYTFKE